MFFYIKSSRWMRKGAASKAPEIGDLKKELEEYKAITLKNARCVPLVLHNIRQTMKDRDEFFINTCGEQMTVPGGHIK